MKYEAEQVEVEWGEETKHPFFKGMTWGSRMPKWVKSGDKLIFWKPYSPFKFGDIAIVKRSRVGRNYIYDVPQLRWAGRRNVEDSGFKGSVINLTAIKRRFNRVLT